MRVKHEPLRVPENWKGQDRALVIQLDRLMDDIYNRLGKLMETQTELRTAAADLDDRVTTLED